MEDMLTRVVFEFELRKSGAERVYIQCDVMVKHSLKTWLEIPATSIYIYANLRLKIDGVATSTYSPQGPVDCISVPKKLRINEDQPSFHPVVKPFELNHERPTVTVFSCMVGKHRAIP
jgi:hypothetical protein